MNDYLSQIFYTCKQNVHVTVTISCNIFDAILLNIVQTSSKLHFFLCLWVNLLSVALELAFSTCVHITQAVASNSG